jgi:hypothetical protein
LSSEILTSDEFFLKREKENEENKLKREKEKRIAKKKPKIKKEKEFTGENLKETKKEKKRKKEMLKKIVNEKNENGNKPDCEFIPKKPGRPRKHKKIETMLEEYNTYSELELDMPIDELNNDLYQFIDNSILIKEEESCKDEEEQQDNLEIPMSKTRSKRKKHPSEKILNWKQTVELISEFEFENEDFKLFSEKIKRKRFEKDNNYSDAAFDEDRNYENDEIDEIDEEDLRMEKKMSK